MRIANWLSAILIGLLSLMAVPANAQEQSTPIIIRGVVDARGPASYIEQGDTHWRGVAHLVAWRVEGQDGPDGNSDGEVRQHPLRVEMPKMDESNAADFQLGFTKRTLVRFSIRGPIKPGEMHDLAIFGETLALKPDAELRTIADARLNPLPFVDAQFGTFTPDWTFPEWLKQERAWLGRDVTISLTLDVNGPPKADAAKRAVETMRGFWEKREAWDAHMIEAIADEYYDVWLKNWRGEGEPVKSRDAFKQHFKIEELSFYPDGAMSALYSDGDLFAGHGMAVDYDADTDSLYVSLFG